jgi:hypothetical protein
MQNQSKPDYTSEINGKNRKRRELYFAAAIIILWGLVYSAIHFKLIKF